MIFELQFEGTWFNQVKVTEGDFLGKGTMKTKAEGVNVYGRFPMFSALS